MAQIKLIPALYDIAKNNLLPKNFSIIGIARHPMSKNKFNDYFYQVLNSKNRHHDHDIDKDVYRNLCNRIKYIDGNLNDPKLYQKITQKIKNQNKMIYLATYPNLYKTIFENLKSSGLSNQKQTWSRIVIEKPLGNDYNTAHKLNNLLLKYFKENQIYRLDHYLGKETMQNIINFRFGNQIFEPLMNKDHIDHIQITATEDFGIGKRGGYYDTVGALKDVGQNHILQMIALATMNDPKNFSNQNITRERINIIKALKPLPENIILGQYKGYKNEKNVLKDSQTETFFAFKTTINNQRYKNIPIYVRAGKKLAQTVTEISIVFKLPLNRLFKTLDCGLEHNVLIFRIQPNEGIVLKILAKAPGHEKKIIPTFMQFCYKTLKGEPADPYEKLIKNTLDGDQTFFNDAPEVEAQWKFIDPLTNAKKKVYIYDQGSWGPKKADELISKDGKKWLTPSPEFCQF